MGYDEPRSVRLSLSWSFERTREPRSQLPDSYGLFLQHRQQLRDDDFKRSDVLDWRRADSTKLRVIAYRSLAEAALKIL